MDFEEAKSKRRNSIEKLAALRGRISGDSWSQLLSELLQYWIPTEELYARGVTDEIIRELEWVRHPLVITFKDAPNQYLYERAEVEEWFESTEIIMKYDTEDFYLNLHKLAIKDENAMYGDKK